MSDCFHLQVLSDKDLREVAAKMRYDHVKSLALRMLDIQDAKMSNIESSFQLVEDRSYKMLKWWRDAKRPTRTRKDLLDVFYQARKNDMCVESEAIEYLETALPEGKYLFAIT